MSGRTIYTVTDSFGRLGLVRPNESSASKPNSGVGSAGPMSGQARGRDLLSGHGPPMKCRVPRLRGHDPPLCGHDVRKSGRRGGDEVGRRFEPLRGATASHAGLTAVRPTVAPRDTQRCRPRLPHSRTPTALRGRVTRGVRDVAMRNSPGPGISRPVGALVAKRLAPGDQRIGGESAALRRHSTRRSGEQRPATQTAASRS
jgi:hypothetical protein